MVAPAAKPSILKSDGGLYDAIIDSLTKLVEKTSEPRPDVENSQVVTPRDAIRFDFASSDISIIPRWNLFECLVNLKFYVQEFFHLRIN